MIAYDLECDAGHVFEGWFDNAVSFDDQNSQGLVTCPICGSKSINKALSTFGIARRRQHEGQAPRTKNPIQQLVEYIQDNFEDVGADFAREALKMHYGVTDYRNIRGSSTTAEEETLRDEGVEFFKVPVPSSSSSDD